MSDRDDIELEAAANNPTAIVALRVIEELEALVEKIRNVPRTTLRSYDNPDFVYIKLEDLEKVLNSECQNGAE